MKKSEPANQSLAAKECQLYSLVIVAYNQEHFIRDTIRAAFAQTYPRLEIVISDDASSDRTWQIIQEEAAHYKGTHKIVLNRNAKNLGIGGGAGKAMQLATGDVIVWNDGDDISLPTRVQVIHDAFEQMGDGVKMIWSNHEPIDEKGKSLGIYKNFQKDTRKKAQTLADIRTRIRIPFGAVTAFRRKVVVSFPEVSSLFLGWDNIIAFRALLLGRIAFVRDVLVQYRKHTQSTLNAPAEDDLVKDYRKRAKYRDAWYVQTFDQYLKDMSQVEKTGDEKDVDKKEYPRVRRVILSLIKKWKVSYDIMSTFPNLSLKLFMRASLYPELYRYFILAPLYRCGIYKRRRK